MKTHTIRHKPVFVRAISGPDMCKILQIVMSWSEAPPCVPAGVKGVEKSCLWGKLCRFHATWTCCSCRISPHLDEALGPSPNTLRGRRSPSDNPELCRVSVVMLQHFRENPPDYNHLFCMPFALHLRLTLLCPNQAPAFDEMSAASMLMTKDKRLYVDNYATIHHLTYHPCEDLRVLVCCSEYPGIVPRCLYT